MDGISPQRNGLATQRTRHDQELVQLVTGNSSDTWEGHADEEHGRDTWRLCMQRYRFLIIAAAVIILMAVIVAIVVAAPHRRKQDNYVTSPPPPAGTGTSTTVSYAGMDPDIVNGLGPVWWPPSTNTSDDANSHFLVGLRMLHVFWYDAARKEFRAAIASDPSFWGGYWGLAMACKQQLWKTEDIPTAQQALQNMQAQVPMDDLTPRELAYVGAVRAMWEPNQTMEQRERSYSASIKAAYTSMPDDVDACAFYALSLLCMTASSENYLKTEEEQQVMTEARATLKKCSDRWWNHTGLLHYITHAYDFPDPAIASQGLAAGVQLSEIATAACHAQHMKSHLFLQLGNWSEVVDSNWRAVKASDQYCNKWEANNGSTVRACDKDDRYHALEWWMYGLTQQCAWRDSLALLGRMMEVYNYLKASPFDQWALRMWAHVIMQSHASPGIPPLVAPLQLGDPALQPQVVLNQLVDATNRTLAQQTDIFWEIHARGSALTAAAYALTIHTNSSGLASTNGQVVQGLHTRIHDCMAMLNASVPVDMEELRDMVALYIMQLTALQSVSACIANNGTTGSSCQDWTTQMDLALEQEDKIWGSPSAPSLQIAPAMEMYGHLLLITLPSNPNKPAALEQATGHFNVCLARLPYRQSCVLGMARASAAAGNALQANTWYLHLWQQCGPWAAPADFMWPGLVEAWWMITPPANRNQTSAAVTGVPSPLFPASHVFLYTYGPTNVYLPISLDSFTPPLNTSEDAIRARLPPYPPPADLDLVNKAALINSGQSYSYPYLGTLLPSGVAGYPDGRLMLNKTTASYMYVEQRNGSEAESFWPPSDGLYTNMLRATP